MKFSQLVPLLVLLERALPPSDGCFALDFSEDCCGQGNLASGVSTWNLNVTRRDVTWCKKN